MGNRGLRVELADHTYFVHPDRNLSECHSILRLAVTDETNEVDVAEVFLGLDKMKIRTSPSHHLGK